MAKDQKPLSLEEQEKWRRALSVGLESHRVYHRLNRLMPSDPRCKLCYGPFAGVGGRLRGLITGFAPSRKNPRLCNRCFEAAPLGGVEVEIGLLFADVRGYTALAETRPPEEVAGLLNRFYAVSSDVLFGRDAIIDKLIGDEVMALFLPGVTGPEYFKKMASAAEGLLRGVGYGTDEGPWLSLGVGLGFGLAFVGNVGSSEVKDFTAIGDVVNTAARLQSEAMPGQIVMSERVYQEVKARYPFTPPVELQLKGKSEPVSAHVVEVG